MISDQDQSVQVKYAGFWIRWVASFVDGIVIGAANLIIGLPVGIFLGMSGSDIDNELNPFKIFFQFFGLILTWSYHIFLNYRYGATFGKRLMGIAVYSTNSERLSFGQLILRETVGKIASTLILFGGYIMVAFTERKQGQHDMIGQTAVIYREPEKSSRKTIIAVIIIAIFGGIVVIGLLASIVLVSLSNARGKANDAKVKTLLSGSLTDAIPYFEKNSSLQGFSPNIALPECSGKSVVHISEDGKVLAIYAKLCSNDDAYWCVDLDMEGEDLGGMQEVSGRDISIPARCDGRKMESIKAESENLEPEKNPTAKLDSLDYSIPPNIIIVADELYGYKKEHGNYKGFVLDSSGADYKIEISNSSCRSKMKLDISPDGNEYVIYQPLCSDSAISFCYEEDMQDYNKSNTKIVSETFHCQN